MTKIFNVATIVSAIILASCGGSNSPEVDKSIMPTADTSNAINPNSSQAVDVQSVQPIQAVPNPSATGAKNIAAPAQVVNATPSTGAGLNPAHGQPGHRCDIAVGAPLNSAPAPAVKTTATPSVTNTPVAVPPVSAPAPTVTAPGMNPPHGQPGHDCAIAVGAPLKKG